MLTEIETTVKIMKLTITVFFIKGRDLYGLAGRKLQNNQALSLTFLLSSGGESLQLKHFWQVNQSKLCCILSNSILMQAFQYKIVFADLPCENNITYDVPTAWMEGKKTTTTTKPSKTQEKITSNPTL